MEKTVSLTKCPDPNGTIDILLKYENLGVVSTPASDEKYNVD
jgi:hypothetical protein